MPIPKLDTDYPRSGSWVCTDPHSGRPTFETFDRSMAEAAAEAGYTVETAYQYLIRLNRKEA